MSLSTRFLNASPICTINYINLFSPYIQPRRIHEFVVVIVGRKEITSPQSLQNRNQHFGGYSDMNALAWKKNLLKNFNLFEVLFASQGKGRQ
jgi:hypothetical protein